jgi:starch-binding outer membrane protein, SusD/RagB family
MRSIYSHKYALSLITIVVLINVSCKKFVEIPPPQNQLTNQSTFSTDAGANAAQLAIFQNMASSRNTNFKVYTSLSSDEMLNYSTNNRYIQLSTNALTADNGYVNDLWTSAYKYIYQANVIIEGLYKSNGVTEKVKQQVSAESKFTRAYWYMWLTNLFGDVPLVLNSTYQISSIQPRTEQAKVFEQIIEDLKYAENNLSTDFLGADALTVSAEKLRPTKYAAQALLARAYYYNKDWQNAEMQSSNVINSQKFSLTEDLNKAFLRNSDEAIWQIVYSPTSNSYDGIYFNLLTFNPGIFAPGAVSPMLFNAFESGDNRKTDWIASATYNNVSYNYPNKYKQDILSLTYLEYEMVLRLAEQYLIRAEARINQDNISEAVSDLNIIRGRARAEITSTEPNPLPDLSAGISKTNAVLAVEHERQVELFTEGHRFIDLKQSGRIDEIMTEATVKKGGTWKTTQQLYPIPAIQRSKNKNLSQNKDY